MSDDQPPFEVNRNLYWCFSKKTLLYMEHLLNSCFYYNYFTPIFSNLYFLELLFLVGDRKINKIYQSKLKSADRLWAYCKLFCIRQILQLSQLDCVTSCPVCFTEKLPLIISETNLRPMQHLKWIFFLILVNVVN